MAAVERTTPSSAAKQHRVLACVHCQQRKVKCDREFPCGNCVKARIQCVQATLNPRQRRRRFPERDLLERLRHYETLLRQHSIKFEPLHPTSCAEKDYANAENGNDPSNIPNHDTPPDASQSSAPVAVKTEPLSFWNAMNQKSPNQDEDEDSDYSDGEMQESDVKNVWTTLSKSNDHLLFGSPKSDIDLSTLHPESVQVFRLWQIYLENIDPILKVTHTPTLQGRIIEAASNVTNINPTLEPLLFAIYCVAVMSLDDETCHATFNSPRGDLLIKYQYGCQQALIKSEYLRSPDRESLTALFLYLVSARFETDPRSLFPMLGVAIRIAQRLGIDMEISNLKCTALEAEMRRRLWWALVLFDTRLCELSGCRSCMLAPVWDCRTPLNLNDLELRPEMKELPKVQGHTTEALLAVVRSELGDFFRHSCFYLDFTSPALKVVAQRLRRAQVAEGDEVPTVEKIMEERYLKFCNPENSLHFMTTWMTRATLSKHRIMEHYSKWAKFPTELTDSQRDAAVSCAMRTIECDTEIMTNNAVKGFYWMADLYFPFPAFVHLVQDLKKRPLSKNAEQAWHVMNVNFEVRTTHFRRGEHLLLKIFNKSSFQAWDTLAEHSAQSGKPLQKPRIVEHIEQQSTPQTQKMEFGMDMTGMSTELYDLSMPIQLGDLGPFYGFPFLDSNNSGVAGSYANLPVLPSMDADLNQFDWTAMDWNQMYNRV